jgi:hypothetical protein
MPTADPPTLESTIRAAILAAPGLRAITDRVRPLIMGASDRRPYVTYQVTGRGSFGTLADGPADYHPCEFEVGIFADSYAQNAAIAERIRDHLDGFGVAASADAVELDADYETDTDVEQVPEEGKPTPVFLRVQTYRGLYRVGEPT